MPPPLTILPHTLTRCLTVGAAARNQMGIHHTNPRRVRALWRTHKRSLQRRGGGDGDGDGTEGGGVHTQGPNPNPNPNPTPKP